MTEQLERLAQGWDLLGRDDPCWAILTHPDKRGNKWSLDEFFETGRREIDGLMGNLTSRFDEVPRGTALDFGCGIGRISRHLARHYERVIGVDVAESMVERARSVNAEISNCEFEVNRNPDLRIIPNHSIDLVYSNIVLQHIEPRICEPYVQEFSRVLSPNGIAVYQIPYGNDWSAKGIVWRLLRVLAPTSYNSLLKWYKVARLGKLSQYIEMHCIPVARVRALVDESEAMIAYEDESKATGAGWRSKRYFVCHRRSSN